jgi:hypothetical protein
MQIRACGASWRLRSPSPAAWSPSISPTPPLPNSISPTSIPTFLSHLATHRSTLTIPNVIAARNVRARPNPPHTAPQPHARIPSHTHQPPLYIFNYFPNSPIRSTACLLASSSSDNCAAGRWFDPHKLPLPRRQRVTETLALAEKATDLVTRRTLTNFGWVGCAFCQFGDLFGGDGRWGGRR